MLLLANNEIEIETADAWAVLDRASRRGRVELRFGDGRPVPRGRVVLAEVDGDIVAALPLGGGAALTDPFRPTAHLLPLLRLRAAQLDRQPRRIAAAKAMAARMLHPAR